MGQSLGSTSHRGFSAYDDDEDLQQEEEEDKRGRRPICMSKGWVWGEGVEGLNQVEGGHVSWGLY